MPVEKARAAARQSREASDKAREEASAAEFERLLTRPVKERLEALEKSETLLPPQRLQLVAHLEGLIVGPGAVDKISAGVANWWEVWLSRLPYRIVPWTARGVVVGGFALVALVAYARTPRDFVMSLYDHDVMVSYVSGGQSYTDELQAKRVYGRVGAEGDWSQLRAWTPSVGYRTFWVQNSYLTFVKR